MSDEIIFKYESTSESRRDYETAIRDVRFGSAFWG